jgi:Fe2+-dicitrate sensor, membrane component
MIQKQALDWAVRTNDPAFADWEAFTLWLEARPEHAAAYDAVCAAALDGAELLEKYGPANDSSDVVVPARSKPRFWQRRAVAGTIAAVMALVLGIGLWQQSAADLYWITTLPGETRMIELKGGTVIAVSGGTRIALDRKDDRFASLERGEVLFTVRHDPNAPFRVEVGEDRLVDIGTEFDVRRVAGDLSVAVSEGAVQFNPDREDVRIAPGQVLSRSAGSERLELSPIPLERVGEWQKGRITFEAAPIARVAADLTNATGIAFSVRGKSGQAAVSGSVLMAPIREDPRRIGDLLGLKVSRTERGWEIGED